MSGTVIVTGSRDWGDAEAIARALAAEEPSLVVHGGARGADTLADHWARAHSVPVKVYPADWRRHGPRAGPLRNELMLRSHPGALVLAFPLDGPGTWHCIEAAQRLRHHVRVFDLDGQREVLPRARKVGFT